VATAAVQLGRAVYLSDLIGALRDRNGLTC